MEADKAPTAVAVVGNTIAAIGDDDSIRPWVGPETTVIDSGGRRVIPGITDSHTHLISGGLQLGRLSLREAAGRDEFVKAVAERAAGLGQGQWLVGGRWSVESWKTPASPRKDWIDPFTPENPVFLTRMDGHQALVNSAALRIAGIDSSRPADPPGGAIERDSDTQEPTGILKEAAMELVERHIPVPTAQERFEALLRAMKHANALGITAVHDMAEPPDLEVFRRAHKQNALSVRLTVYLTSDDWAQGAREAAAFGVKSDMLRVAGLKGYMDGSLGSRTAYMREPFTDAAPDAPYPRGHLTAFFARSAGSIEAAVAAAHARGLQLAVHAIGDEANHIILDAYATVSRLGSDEHIMHRVEHAQHLLPEDFSRFAALGVVASMQPFHKADDGRYAEKAIGGKRLAGSYAFRQLLDAGALLCFGSDWPVVTMDPFVGIEAAVSARTLDGKVWLASHSLTSQEALRAYTVWPQRAVGRDKELGTLGVGKLADLIVLSIDPLTIDSGRLEQVKVSHTILGGKIVYRAEKP